METKTALRAALVLAMLLTSAMIAMLVASGCEGPPDRHYSKSPAPRPLAAANNVTNHGGPVLSKTKVRIVLWGSGVQFAAQLDGFYSAVLASPYYDWLNEYDTATQKIGRGTLGGSTTDPTPPVGAAITDQQIQTEQRRRSRGRSVGWLLARAHAGAGGDPLVRAANVRRRDRLVAAPEPPLRLKKTLATSQLTILRQNTARWSTLRSQPSRYAGANG